MSDRGAPQVAGLLALLALVWVIVYWVTPASTPDAPMVVEGVDHASSDDASWSIDTSASRSFDETDEEVPPFDAETLVEQEPLGEGVTVVPPTYRIHVVAPGGETLQDISKRYFDTYDRWRDIARANGHSIDPNRLPPGTEVKVPLDPENVQGLPTGEGATAEPEPAYTEYIVSSNDSLWTIAKALYGSGAKWTIIRDANRDQVGNDGALVHPGMVLKIPPPPGN